MRSIANVIWPMGIVLLLALLGLKSGGSSLDNPLGADPVSKWFSNSANGLN